MNEEPRFGRQSGLKSFFERIEVESSDVRVGDDGVRRGREGGDDGRGDVRGEVEAEVDGLGAKDGDLADLRLAFKLAAVRHLGHACWRLYSVYDVLLDAVDLLEELFTVVQGPPAFCAPSPLAEFGPGSTRIRRLSRSLRLSTEKARMDDDDHSAAQDDGRGCEGSQSKGPVQQDSSLQSNGQPP